MAEYKFEAPKEPSFLEKNKKFGESVNLSVGQRIDIGNAEREFEAIEIANKVSKAGQTQEITAWKPDAIIGDTSTKEESLISNAGNKLSDIIKNTEIYQMAFLSEDDRLAEATKMGKYLHVRPESIMKDEKSYMQARTLYKNLYQQDQMEQGVKPFSEKQIVEIYPELAPMYNTNDTGQVAIALKNARDVRETRNIIEASSVGWTNFWLQDERSNLGTQLSEELHRENIDQLKIGKINERIVAIDKQLGNAKEYGGFWDTAFGGATEIVGAGIKIAPDIMSRGGTGGVAGALAGAVAGGAGALPAGVAGFGYGATIGVAEGTTNLAYGNNFIDLYNQTDEYGNKKYTTSEAQSIAMGQALSEGLIEAIGLKGSMAVLKAVGKKALKKQIAETATKEIIAKGTLQAEKEVLKTYAKNFAKGTLGTGAVETGTEIAQDLANMGIEDIASKAITGERAFNTNEYIDNAVETFVHIAPGAMLLGFAGTGGVHIKAVNRLLNGNQSVTEREAVNRQAKEVVNNLIENKAENVLYQKGKAIGDTYNQVINNQLKKAGIEEVGVDIANLPENSKFLKTLVENNLVQTEEIESFKKTGSNLKLKTADLTTILKSNKEFESIQNVLSFGDVNAKSDKFIVNNSQKIKDLTDLAIEVGTKTSNEILENKLNNFTTLSPIIEKNIELARNILSNNVVKPYIAVKQAKSNVNRAFDILTTDKDNVNATGTQIGNRMVFYNDLFNGKINKETQSNQDIFESKKKTGIDTRKTKRDYFSFQEYKENIFANINDKLTAEEIKTIKEQGLSEEETNDLLTQEAMNKEAVNNEIAKDMLDYQKQIAKIKELIETHNNINIVGSELINLDKKNLTASQVFSDEAFAEYEKMLNTLLTANIDVKSQATELATILVSHAQAIVNKKHLQGDIDYTISDYFDNFSLETENQKDTNTEGFLYNRNEIYNQFGEKRGKGYIGKSMSVNARNSYLNNEMPLNKWNKSNMIDTILEANENLNEEILNKFTVKMLKDNFLTEAGWHHTGVFYNITYFYKINDEYLNSLDNNELQKMLDNKPKRVVRDKAIIEAEKVKKEARRAEREYENLLKDLFEYQDKYKTFTGFKKGLTENRVAELKAIRDKKQQEQAIRDIKKKDAVLFNLYVFDEKSVNFSDFKNNLTIAKQIRLNNLKTAGKINDRFNIFYELTDKKLPFKKWKRQITKQEIAELKKRAFNLKEKVKNPKENEVFFQKQQKEKVRGTMQIVNNGEKIITLFKDANKSTFIHEMGHLFLSDLQDLANSEHATEQDIKDLETVRKYFKIDEDLTAGHEAFARSFELFLMEGKTTNAPLKNIFAKFKNWLTSIYKLAKNLDTTINEEIVELMDGMMYFDENITKNIEELYNAPANYNQNTLFEIVKNEVKESAVNKVRKELYLYRKAENTKKIIDEFIDEVKKDLLSKKDQDIYRVQILEKEFGLEDGLKIIGIDKKYYDKKLTETGNIYDIVSKAEKRKLEDIESDNNRYTNDLISLALQEPENAIKVLVTQEVLAQESIENAKLEFNKNAEIKALLKELHEKASAENSLYQKASLEASQKLTIEALTDANNFELQARMTQVDIYKLLKENKVQEAMAQIKRQKMAMYMLKHSRKAKTEVDKQANIINKKIQAMKNNDNVNIDERCLYETMAFNLNISKKKPVDYTDFNVDNIFKDALTEEVDIPDIVTKVLNEKNVSLNKLTLQEFQELKEVMINIYTKGKRANEFNKLFNNEGLAVTKDEVVDELVNSIYENYKTADDIQTEVLIERERQQNIRSWADKVITSAGEYMINLAGVRVFFSKYDGGDINGGWTRYFYNTMALANQNYLKRYQKENSEYIKLVDSFYNKKDKHSMINEQVANIYGYKLTKYNLLSVALNWGTNDNYNKIIEGIANVIKQEFSVVEAELQSALDENMSGKDWEFIQATWKFINKFYQERNEIIIKETGTPLKKVKGRVFMANINGKNVSIKGEYYPIKYDTSKDVNRNETTMSNLLSGESTSLGLNTNLGSTKARIEFTGKEIKLKFNEVMGEAINESVTHIELREAVQDVLKILNDERIKNIIVQADNKKAYNDFKDWLSFIWNNKTNNQKVVAEGMLGKLAGLFGRATMTFNIKVALLNFGNIAVSMDRYGIGNTLRAYKNGLTNLPEQIKFAKSKSLFLENRINNIYAESEYNEKIKFHKNKVLGKLSDADDLLHKYGFSIIEFTDVIISTPVWVDKYERQLAENFNNIANVIAMDELEKQALKRQIEVAKEFGSDTTEFETKLDKTLSNTEIEKMYKNAEQDAISKADLLIKTMASSGEAVDQSTFQRKKSLINVLTPFSSYFMTLTNNMLESYYKDKGLKVNSKTHKHLLRSVGLTFIGMAIIEQTMQMVVDKMLGDDDDESYIKSIAYNSINNALLGLPVVRDLIGNGLAIVFDEKVFNTSASFTAFNVTQDLTNLAKSIKKGDDERTIKSTLNLTSDFVGLSKFYTNALMNVGNLLADNNENDKNSFEVMLDTIFKKNINRKQGGK